VGPEPDVDVSISNPGIAPVNVNSAVVCVTGTPTGSSCPASDFVVSQPSALVSAATGAAETLPVVIPAGGLVAARPDYAGSVPTTVALVSSAPASCEHVTVNLSETAS
jgi:hypothetical protein